VLAARARSSVLAPTALGAGSSALDRRSVTREGSGAYFFQPGEAARFGSCEIRFACPVGGGQRWGDPTRPGGGPRRAACEEGVPVPSKGKRHPFLPVPFFLPQSPITAYAVSN
jgi:hypothetical protein